MIITVLWFTMFTLYQIITILFLLVIKVLWLLQMKTASNKLANNFVRTWARFMVLSTGSKVEIVGEELLPKDKAVLFIGNHQSDFDIPLLLGFINKPMGFIAKKELEKVPMISTWMKQIKCVFIDRKNPRDGIKGLGRAFDNVKNNHSMVLFPEGTRSKGPAMGEFKKASIKLALKNDMLIVPLTIDGSYKLLEGNNNRIKKGKIRLVIGKPIDPSSLTKEDKEDFDVKIKNMIGENLR